MATVGEAYVKIVPDASGFSAGLKSQVDGALKGIDDSVSGVGKKIKDEFEKPLDDTKEKVKGLGEEFKNLGKLIGAAAVGRAVVNFAKDSIAAASDLSESINAVQVTFGDLSDEILAFSENSAKAVGLSSADFNSFAVRFAGFTKVIATDGKNAAQVTTELTTRIADFASVMNLDLNEAATVFASTLAGESEAIRRFGIDMSAASIEAFALEQGLIANKNEMTAAIKVQATYAKLMADTAQVAGDFANTSDGLANQQRILSAEFKNLQATIGAALVPVLQSLIGAVQPVFNAFVGLPDPIQQLVAVAGLATAGFWAMSTAIQAVGVSAGVANPIIAGIVVALAGVAVVYNGITRGAKEAKAEQDSMIASLQAANDPTWSLISAFEGLAASLEQVSPESEMVSNALGDVSSTVEIVTARLIKFNKPLQDAGVSIKQLAEITATGTDTFEDLFDKMGYLANDQKLSEVFDIVADRIKEVTNEGDPLRQILLDLASSSTMTVGEFDALIMTLDSTADGFDQAAKAAEENAKSLLNNENIITELTDLVGVDFYSNLITSAEAMENSKFSSDEWQSALRTLNEKVKELGYVIDPTTRSLVKMGDAQEDTGDATSDTTAEIQKQEDALWDLIDATLAQFNSEIQLEQSKRKTSDAIAEYNQLIHELETGTYQGSDAFRDIAESSEEVYLASIRQAEAAVQVAKDTATAAGATLSAEDANRILRDELLKVVATLDPKNPLRAQLMQYIRELGQIPKNVSTNITTTYTESQVRRVETTPSGMGSGRTTSTTKTTTTSKSSSTGTSNKLKSGKFADGGIIMGPQFGLVGEAGPEVIIPLTRRDRALELMRETGLESLARSRGATVNIETAVFQNGTDANLVAQKVNAAERSRSFST